MRLTYLLAVTASILALAGADTDGPAKKRVGVPVVGSPAANEIEDSTKTGAVGPGSAGLRVVRAQILLDRARFSPGEIDGVYGDDFGVAVKGYQENHGLKPTGTIDAGMWRLLNRDAGPFLLTYAITQADEKGPFLPLPAEVQEKAKLKWLGFETPEEGLGERFHISPKLLAELNPGKKLGTAGERITVPNVRRAAIGLALRVVVSKSKRTVIAYGARRQGTGAVSDHHWGLARSSADRSLDHRRHCALPVVRLGPEDALGCGQEAGESGTRAGSEQSRRRCLDRPLETGLWNPWDTGSGEYRARRVGRVYPADELGCGRTVAHGSAGHTGRPGGVALRLCVCIAALLPVLIAVGATSSILEMTPPIRGLALANLRDTFEELHDGNKHEAIDIMEPRGTPVHAVVAGTIRKLFLSKPGGNTIYQFDEMGVYCYYYAHLDRYAEGLREGMRVKSGVVIGFVGSTGKCGLRARHTCILRSSNWGRKSCGGRGRPLNPYPGLVAAVKRAK